eukprot:s1342_g12.t1
MGDSYKQSHAQSWWCTQCRRFVKQSAKFCPECGTSWSQAAYSAGWQDSAEAGWKQDYEQWPRSARAWSPRRRGQKGQKGKKEKGKSAQPLGKGPGEKRPERAPRIPTTDQLPKPPSWKAFPGPKETASGSTEASADRKALETLLDHLGSQADIPDSVRAVVAQINQTTARSEAKNLHRLLYAQGLMDLLSKQFEEREEALTAMDESFTSWANRLAEASRALKHATNQETDGSGDALTVEDSDEEDDGMEAELDKNTKEAAQMEAKRQALTVQHQNLSAALAAVRDSASEGASKDKSNAEQARDRTPRRKKDQAKDAAKEKGKVKDEGGLPKASAPPGSPFA